MALVLPELAKDVDISPNEVFQNTGVRASVSGLADAVDLATSSVATAEALKQAGPTEVVLLQELERFNKLIRTMKASLNELKRALIGEVGMSSQLDDLASALFNGFIPPQWAKLAPAIDTVNQHS
jgi:hypothetical protein